MIDLIGKKFGRLTIIMRLGKNKWGQYFCQKKENYIGENFNSV